MHRPCNPELQAESTGGRVALPGYTHCGLTSHAEARSASIFWQGHSGGRRRHGVPLGGPQAAADADVRLRRRVHAQGLHLPPPAQAEARCRVEPAIAACQRGGGAAIRRRPALPKELVHRGVRRGAGRRVLAEGRAADCSTAAAGSRRERACVRRVPRGLVHVRRAVPWAAPAAGRRGRLPAPLREHPVPVGRELPHGRLLVPASMEPVAGGPVARRPVARGLSAGRW